MISLLGTLWPPCPPHILNWPRSPHRLGLIDCPVHFFSIFLKKNNFGVWGQKPPTSPPLTKALDRESLWDFWRPTKIWHWKCNCLCIHSVVCYSIDGPGWYNTIMAPPDSRWPKLSVQEMCRNLSIFAVQCCWHVIWWFGNLTKFRIL